MQKSKKNNQLNKLSCEKMADTMPFNIVKTQSKAKSIIAIVVAFVLTYGNIFYADLHPSAWGYVAVFSLLFCAVSQTIAKLPTKGEIAFLMPFSAVFTFFIFAIKEYNRSVFSLAILFFTIYCATVFIEKLCLYFSFEVSVGGNNIKLCAKYFAGIMAFWGIIFLIFGPVRLSADSSACIAQSLDYYPINNTHPVYYTMLIGAFLRFGQMLGNISIGAYLFGFCQMSFMAGVVSFLLYKMHCYGSPKILLALSFLYYTLTPVFGINAITMWKDIPFSACLVLLMLTLYKQVQTKGALLKTNKGLVEFSVLCFVTCFLRGNGKYIVLLCLVAVLIVYIKDWKRLLVAFVPLMIVVQLIQGPFYTYKDYYNRGNVEMAAVPIQQVVRSINNGAKVTAKQKVFLEKIIPFESMKRDYMDYAVDFIMYSKDFDIEFFNANTKEFLQIWLDLAPENANHYFDAWRELTHGYWQIDVKGNTCCLEEDFNGYADIHYQDLIKRFTGISLWQNLAERTQFFSMGSMALFTLFTFAVLLYKKVWRYCLALLPLLLTWAMLLVSAPTELAFRYMFCVALGLPFVAFMLFSNPVKTKENTENIAKKSTEKTETVTENI